MGAGAESEAPSSLLTTTERQAIPEIVAVRQRVVGSADGCARSPRGPVDATLSISIGADAQPVGTAPTTLVTPTPSAGREPSDVASPKAKMPPSEPISQ